MLTGFSSPARAGASLGLKLLVVLAVFIFASSAFAEPEGKKPVNPELKSIMDKVQNYYVEAGDFSADFEQIYISKMTRREKKSTGKVHFSKPSKMRWEYEQPQKTALITDGKKAWYALYDKKEVKTYEKFKSSYVERSMAFFWGSGDLSADYGLRLLKAKRVEDLIDAGSREVIEAIPHQRNAQFEILYLFVDAKTGRIEEVLWFDTIGNSNNLKFNKPQTGRKFQDAFFTFQLPSKEWTVEKLEF